MTMTDSPDWFTHHIPTFEKRLARFKGKPNVRALQIGAFTGRCSEWLCDNILTGEHCRLIDVDTWEGSSYQETLDWDQIEAEYLARIEGKPVERYKITSGEFGERFDDIHKFDFIYVDGSHYYADVVADGLLVDEYLADGGIVCFDDYLWARPERGDDIPKPAIDEWLTRHSHDFTLLDLDVQAWAERRPLRVGVYTIAKNEAAHVQPWAESAAEADEILMVDTGSTDGTLAEASAYGIVTESVVIDPFRFDVARTAALALVGQDIDVCVSLDMDERLEPGWRQEVEQAWALGAREMTFRLDCGSYEHRNTKAHARRGYRWKYAAHNVVVGDGPKADTAATIEHLQDDRPDRTARSPLMHLNVAEHPDDPRAWYYSAREHYYRNEWDEARIKFLRYLAIATFDEERSEACQFMAQMVWPDSQERWLMRACYEAPQRREPWANLAKWYAEQGMMRQAQAMADRARMVTEVTPRNSFNIQNWCWADDFGMAWETEVPL